MSTTERATATGQGTRHPLDPLGADEIRATVQALHEGGYLTEGARIAEVSLREPSAEALLGFRQGEAPRREISVVVFAPGELMTCEALVDPQRMRVIEWRPVPGVQAPITLDEYAEAEAALKAHPGFRTALARRGIEGVDQVMIESWSVGSSAPDEDKHRRLAWALCFYRGDPAANPYAKPVEGLHALIDLATMEVVRVDDRGIVPLPPGDGGYTPDRVGALRTDLKALEIRQPEGVSFAVEGWEVRWQKWQFRVGFNQREGLTLHALAYNDGGRARPVLSRASVAELVIPYGDPRPYHAWQNAFDIGEYGLGSLVNSLELGCDCLGEIRYFDVELSDNKGNPYTIRNAICMHEEDFGLLWKHYDAGLDHAETRRCRRLVISSIATFGNYEYGFYWYLYQDGTIELEIKLTGIMLTSALPPGETREFGTLVAPQLLATNHQHFFCIRLDMSVDGLQNSLYEVNTEALPMGAGNPLGNAFAARATPLRTELEAQRSIDLTTGRYWLIVSHDKKNALGQPTGYKLVPHWNTFPYYHPKALITQRAAFITKHLWATPYTPGERYPAGEYPNQHPGGAGLPDWTRANRSLENTHLVLWYTLGSNHIPRVEDWPVMPVERVGFSLKPSGFFDRNPSLDVPPSTSHCPDMRNHIHHATSGE